MTELRLAELTAGDIEATIGLDLRPARERFFAPFIRSIDLYAPAAPRPRRTQFAPTAAESRAGSATESQARGRTAMRPVILSATVSLDGMTAAPGAGFEAIDWFRADDEWLDYSVEILDRADVLLFGWTTFAGMAQYWPTADGPVAERMNRLEKVGFSRSARETTWQHARVSADPVAEVARLKADEGDGSLLILGSANLASTLTGHGLIDEYRLAMTPVALGAGTPLIPAGSPRVEFDLADTRVFASGVVELRCTPRPPTVRS